ncbi:MAG: hypothetical protein ACREAX_01830 [Candidatus Nitrosotenuis sp.]
MNKFLIILGALCVFSFLNSATNFANAQSTNSTQDIVYTAKFVCGSIYDDEGPLRPGHYDTSINILNKKSYQVSILWNAVINDGPASISIFKMLKPEASTGFSCKDIKEIFGIETKEMVEGFALVKIPLSSLRGFGSEQVIPDMLDQINVLDVQAFYTANALDTLPHEVAQEKIAFYIIQDGTGKIPKDSFRKLLDVTLPSTLNEVSDTEQKVKSSVAKKFGLDKKEIEKVRVRVKSISIGVGAMLDDHAVSLHVVKPQFSS